MKKAKAKEDKSEPGKVGKPRTYRTPDEMVTACNVYLEARKADGIPLTITGLCLGLGISKETFYEYAKRPEYSASLKMARLIVENDYEISLRRDKNPAGPIFALKNFGWSDAQIDTGFDTNRLMGKLMGAFVSTIEKNVADKTTQERMITELQLILADLDKDDTTTRKDG